MGAQIFDIPQPANQLVGRRLIANFVAGIVNKFVRHTMFPVSRRELTHLREVAIRLARKPSEDICLSLRQTSSHPATAGSTNAPHALTGYKQEEATHSQVQEKRCRAAEAEADVSRLPLK